MKKILLGAVLLSFLPSVACAQLTVPQGGTGTTTFPNGYIVTGGPSSLRITAIPVVPTANGGTATSTFYNGGAIFYNSSLGTLSQSSDGKSFFWDETNKRLGLGTTAPTTALEVTKAASAVTLKVTGNSSTVASGFSVGDGLAATNLFTSVVNPSGTSNSNLATVPLSATFQTGAGTTGGIYFVAKAANSPIVFGAGASAFTGEHMRIDGSTGFVGVGTTTPWRLLSVGVSNTGSFAVSTSTAGCAQFSPFGEVYSTGNNCGTGNITSIVAGAGLLGGTITTSGTITNTFATSSVPIIGGLPYFTNIGATTGTALFGTVATTTLTASSPLTGSFTQVGSGGSLGCQTASGSQAGCLSSADWTTFNGKVSTQWTGTSPASIYYTANNVGVGTTSPYAALSVSTTTQDSATATLFAVASTTNATLFDVLGNGNVGIGTTSPSGLLSIVNRTDTTNALHIINTFVGGASGGAGPAGYTGIVPVASGDRLGYMAFGYDAGGTVRNSAVVQGVATQAWTVGSAQGTAIAFGVTANGSASRVEAMRVDQNGNLGIGTTTPATLASIGGNLFVGAATAGGTAGRIGIGTAVPANPLQIVASGQVVNWKGTDDTTFVYTQFNTSASTGQGYFGVEGSVGGTVFTNSLPYATFLVGSASGRALQLGTVGAARLTIDSNGNVGIGITAPTQPLQLDKSQNALTLAYVSNTNSGTGAAAGYKFSSDGGDSYFYRTSTTYTGGSPDSTYFQDAGGGDIVLFTNAEVARFTNGGRLGVGTSTPWRTLAVTGSVGFDGLTGSAGLQVGILCLSANKEVINESVACVASAARFKKDVETLNTGLAEVMKLRPVSFLWKDDYNGALQNNPNFSGQQISLIADEVQKIDPRLISVTTATTTFEGKTYAPGTVEGLASANAWAGLFVSTFHDIEKQILAILSHQSAQDKQIDMLQVQNTKLQQEIDTINKKLK